MSVFVKDIDVPGDCDGCWHPTCNLWHQTDVGKRHKDCPISPMPEKHGRLGDLDEIKNKLAKDKREAFTKHDVWLMLSRYGAETIVEAEGE